MRKEERIVENLGAVDDELTAEEYAAFNKALGKLTIHGTRDGRDSKKMGTITGTLKTAADRLYAELECLGYAKFPQKSVLLMTADGGDYSQAVTWYRTYERNLRW